MLEEHSSAKSSSGQVDPYSGAAAYTETNLALYDLFVLGLSMRWIWGCPNRRVIDLYERGMGERHLDVGAGTGYFPAKARTDGRARRIHLLDLNPVPPAHAARRLKRFAPEVHIGNALEGIPLPGRSLDSVALSLLLHCVPGNIRDKAVIFDHAAGVLRPGGRLFGATVLARGVPLSAAASRLMSVYQRKGIFHNSEDSLDDLRAELGKRFTDCEITVHGCVALFEGTAE